ncbi:MAG: hypothetical protein C4341_04300 [Armatimonadota bacterium]
MKLVRHVLVLFVTLSLCIAVAQNETPGYRLKPGDVVRVRYLLRAGTLNEPHSIIVGDGLDMRLEVPPTGDLVLPYVGGVASVGKTVEEVGRTLTTRLRERFRNAEAFVVLESVRRDTFSIIGEVSRGGQFELIPGTTLRQALALGGETTRRPELLRAALFRQGKPRLEFDLYEVQAADSTLGDEALQPGDVISIQTKRQMRVWASGFTRVPGEVAVEQGTTLRQLVANVAIPQVSIDNLHAEEHVEVTLQRSGQTLVRATLRDVRAGIARDLELQDGDYVAIAPEETDRIWVFGAVGRPGQYNVPAGSNVLQAIAAAAGANPTATLKIVEVLRGEQVRSLDLSATSPSQEDKRFTMQEGDIIYVRPNVRRVVVLGEVNSPGLHILSDDMQPRISDALALAGGMTRRGPATRISIVRVQPNGEVIRIPVDFSRYLKNAEAEFNPEVLPGDVVVVGETPRIDVQTVMSLTLGLLGIRNFLR